MTHVDSDYYSKTLLEKYKSRDLKSKKVEIPYLHFHWAQASGHKMDVESKFSILMISTMVPYCHVKVSFLDKRHMPLLYLKQTEVQSFTSIVQSCHSEHQVNDHPLVIK
jgi:hypothetical protein